MPEFYFAKAKASKPRHRLAFINEEQLILKRFVECSDQNEIVKKIKIKIFCQNCFRIDLIFRTKHHHSVWRGEGLIIIEQNCCIVFYYFYLFKDGAGKYFTAISYTEEIILMENKSDFLSITCNSYLKAFLVSASKILRREQF